MGIFNLFVTFYKPITYKNKIESKSCEEKHSEFSWSYYEASRLVFSVLIFSLCYSPSQQLSQHYEGACKKL